jgi:hypothetical protein
LQSETIFTGGADLGPLERLAIDDEIDSKGVTTMYVLNDDNSYLICTSIDGN